MEIQIIHVSDIHIKEGHNSFDNKVTSFFDAIKNECLDKQKLFLVITGDSAFSGKVKEYEIVTKKLKQISKDLRNYTGAEVEFIIIAGNHDCQFKTNKDDIRSILLDSIREDSSKITDQIKDNLTSIQADYFNYEKDLEDGSNSIFKDQLLEIKKYQIGDQQINFLKLNTAWDSELHEIPGSMNFPIELYETRIRQLEGTTIALLHHPVNWQVPSKTRKLKEIFVNHTTLVLSGHEHTNSFSGIHKIDTQSRTLYIEADALQDSSNDENSGFQLITIDFDTNRITKKQYTWNKEKYSLSDESDTVFTAKASNHRFSLIEEFKDYLTSTGLSYSHTYADQVTLNDLYIIPNLVNILGIKSKVKNTKSFDENFIEVNKTTSILGAESSGKTSICKKIYTYFYDKGMIPILIKGSSIKYSSKKKLVSLLYSHFENQYIDVSKDIFDQINKNDIVIIIDDFHLSKLDNKRKANFLENLTARYSYVYYSASDLMQFELFLDDTETLSETFSHHKITECGPSLRNELIKKWILLGREDHINQNEYLDNIDRLHKAVDSLIGKNLVPAYPFFIICILQMQESTLNTNAPSMHGFYYELLINNNISAAKIKKDETGFIRNFIGYYCNFLFESRIKLSSISISDFRRLVRKYNEEHYTNEHEAKVLRNLTEAKLIIIQNENVTVAHKYIYYYYVASVMSKRIDQPKTREKIIAMCQRLYREEYFNIILFITHLTNGDLIIDELLANTKKCFASTTPIKLQEDTQFLNDMIKSLPEKVVSLTLGAEEVRKEELTYKDKKEIAEKELELEELTNSDYDLSEDISTLDGISRLNRALKSIELLGQIAKKYWGELQGGRKIELVSEAYNAGLRILGFLLKSMEDNEKELSEYINKVITSNNENKELEKNQVEKESGKLLFGFATMASYGVIKRISDSVGHEKLENIFDKIESDNPTNAVSLINISVGLEHLKGFPFAKIKQNKRNIEKHFLSNAVLQRLVENYLHLFNTSISEKQQISELTGIRVQDQRRISLTSQVKKSKKGLG